MKPEVKTYATTVGSQTITFETGKLAGQAGGAVTVRLGDSIVFASATMGGVREGIDFFPLSVDFEERLYATGKIPVRSSAAKDVPAPTPFSQRVSPTDRCARCSPRACATKCRSSCSRSRPIASTRSIFSPSMPLPQQS